MRTANRRSFLRRLTWPPLAFGLAVGILAGGARAQSDPPGAPPGDHPVTDGERIERRIQVVFSDDEGVTEERIWIAPGDETGPLGMSGDGRELLIEAAPLLASRTYLGVQLLDITPELREHFGAAPEAGVLVSAVADDSPAAAAGIRVGDLVIAIDDEQVARVNQVLRRLAGHDSGDAVRVELVRQRRSLAVDAVLAERPRRQVDLAPMFWTPADGERRVMRLPNHVIHIEDVDLEEAFSELHERLGSPEWHRKLEEAASRRRTLENRIQELEERLREMEERLDEDPE